MLEGTNQVEVLILTKKGSQRKLSILDASLNKTDKTVSP